VELEGLAAAWEALDEFNPGRETARDDFVRGRVLARVLARYRREWAYGRRCDSDTPDVGNESWAIGPMSSAPILEEAPGILDRLAEADRNLIRRLFVDRWTEAQIARELGISQPAVSKRKRAILLDLRHWSREI
jgi:DNA-directed RNA polymerase specialized sigma24 family protein